MRSLFLMVTGLLCSLVTSAQVASRLQYGVVKLGNNMVDSAGAIKILFPPGTGGGGSSQWTTSGSSIYYNGGNVGVGLTNPDAGIHLKMASDGYQKGFTVQAASDDRLHLYYESGGFIWDAYRFSDQRRASLYFQPNGGNVGFGTLTPSEKVDVNGVVKTSGGIRFSDGSLQTTAASGSGGGAGNGIPYINDLAGLAAATADVVEYDGSKWKKSSGTVESDPQNNGKYTALQYNAGSNHYDRLYSGWAYFSWWRNSGADRHNQLRYAMNAFAGIKIQVEDGTYTYTNYSWTPGNFTLRGNLEDPSKVVFNITDAETRIFRGWFYYDGTSDGQRFENITIEGITFNQKSTSTTPAGGSPYGPIAFEGASTQNLRVRRNIYNQVSTTAITNFIFVKAGANKLIKDILIEENVSRNTTTFGRIGVEIINQDNHPNNDQVTGTNILVRFNDFGGFDYCYSIAGNFAGVRGIRNLIGSNTSYGWEFAGNNLNGIVEGNSFYGSQNILIASNYLGENGTAQGDYVITGGQQFINNKTMGYVVGNVEIRGGGAMQFNGNDLNISGGIYFKKTQFGGVVSAEFKNNHIVSAGIGSTPNQALLYLDGASNIRATGNTLERSGSATTALIQADGSLSTGSFFYGNTLDKGNGSYFGLTNGATWNVGINYTLAGTAISDGEQPIGTFALAKAAITPGTRKTFLIANNELYNAPTRSIYDGTNWFHSPALFQNN